MIHPTAPLLAFVAIVSCAEFPQIDRASAIAGPPPELVPLDSLLLQADINAPPQPSVAQRAARLQARAALMRGPILDLATRERLGQALP